MKKVFLIFFLLLALICFFAKQAVFAEKDSDTKWTKINKYIYIDKSSITKDKDLVSGWFKLYNSPENELHSINNIDVEYEIVKYEVYCTNDAIQLKHIKSFDKNNNLLQDEPYNYSVGCSCRGLIDGEIICKTICEN